MSNASHMVLTKEPSLFLILWANNVWTCNYLKTEMIKWISLDKYKIGFCKCDSAENSRYLLSDWLCVVVPVAKPLSCISLCISIKIPLQAEIYGSKCCRVSLVYLLCIYTQSVQLGEQIQLFCLKSWYSILTV